MTKYDLLLELQKEAEIFELDVLRQQREEIQKANFGPGTLAQQSLLNTIYDVTALISLKTATKRDVGEERINEHRLKSFEVFINQYLNQYAIGGAMQKNMIRLACTYLAFIEEKPLHSVGTTFNGKYLGQRFDQYYCPQKATELRDPGTLCHFCVAHCMEMESPNEIAELTGIYLLTR